MAKLYSSQLESERLLRQDSPRAGQPGQGQLLDAGPHGPRHVRQWLLPQEEEEVQAARDDSPPTLPLPRPLHPAAAAPERDEGGAEPGGAPALIAFWSSSRWV